MRQIYVHADVIALFHGAGACISILREYDITEIRNVIGTSASILIFRACGKSRKAVRAGVHLFSESNGCAPVVIHWSAELFAENAVSSEFILIKFNDKISIACRCLTFGYGRCRCYRRVGTEIDSQFYLCGVYCLLLIRILFNASRS